MKHTDYRASLESDPLYIKGQKALKTKFAVGDAILRARFDRGWSQTELAKRVGTKQANISRIEAGTTNPTLDFVQRVLNVLELNIIIVPFPQSLLIAETSSEYCDYDGNPVEWPSNASTASTANNSNDVFTLSMPTQEIKNGN